MATYDVTIVLPSGTYYLTIPPLNADGDESGDLDLTGNHLIRIQGAGAASTIIDANHIDRAFTVHAGSSGSITSVTVRNGTVAGRDGGGINVNYNGNLAVVASRVSGNTTDSSGGGIENDGTLYVTGSAVSGNNALAGGGISNYGSVLLNESTMAGNTASENGGGLYSGGSLDVIQSTINANTADFNGGGIYSFGNFSDLTLTDSTVAINEAVRNGGGIYHQGNSANLYNVTIAYNDADYNREGYFGGGVYVAAGANLNVRNSLLAANTMENTPIYDDCDGDGHLVSYGRNVLGTDASTLSGCNITPASGSLWDNLNSLAFLGGLAYNGGPTQTIALLNGNNAIDAGDPAFGFACLTPYSGPLNADQRGFTRPAGVYCDLGAFEYGAVNPDDEIFKNGFE
ncbi:MAG: choice-of-anchor Q domain-containing protein [Dokdonella sp.]